jgi:hypothetical protein
MKGEEFDRLCQVLTGCGHCRRRVAVWHRG